MLRRALAWFCVLAAGAPAGGQLPRVVIDEDFDRLDPELWKAATNGRWQTGAPDAFVFAERNGRSVLEMTSTLTGPDRRGFLTIPTFPARSCVVEMDFCPLAGPDVPLELWIIFPFGDAFIATGPFATGTERSIRVEVTANLWTFGAVPPWKYGRWYRLVCRAGDSFRAAIHDELGQQLWSATFPWRLCEVAPEWGVGVLQYMQEGHGPALTRAAVDHLRVTLTCGADFDGDGRLTVQDAVLFNQRFAGLECTADLDDDHLRTINDFAAFQRAFAAGCP